MTILQITASQPQRISLLCTQAATAQATFAKLDIEARSLYSHIDETTKQRVEKRDELQRLTKRLDHLERYR